LRGCVFSSTMVLRMIAPRANGACDAAPRGVPVDRA